MDTQKIEAAVKMIIEAVGEDANREGLRRNACSCRSYVPRDFSGLGQTAEEHLSKSFEIIDDNMVVEKDIFSILCVNTTSCHFMVERILPIFQMAVWQVCLS